MDVFLCLLLFSMICANFYVLLYLCSPGLVSSQPFHIHRVLL